MTLPGGAADKAGNRYEKQWTVSELIRMLLGHSDAIRIEDLGVEKVEFVVMIGSNRELHQAKRSHTTGKWTLAQLAANRTRLVQAMGEQLDGNNDRFVFVSSSDAPELSELCDAARDAESDDEFEQVFLKAKARSVPFDKLRDYWQCDLPTALGRLKRIEIRTISEQQLREKTRWGAQALFLSEPDPLLNELERIVEQSVHKTITRDGLKSQLANAGHRMRRLTAPESAADLIRDTTDRYLQGARRPLIQNRLVPRAMAGDLLARLEGSRTDNVLTGKAGVGKTACVVQTVDELRTRGLPVLAFRLDRLPQLSTIHALANHLDLEESPVLTLAAAAEAAQQPGVLIIDQLDAVSAVSGRTADTFDLVERLLQDARGASIGPAVHTVVVCRDFDWRNDSRFRQLIPEESGPQVVVTEFTPDEVTEMLVDASYDPGLFHSRQLELLALPQNLSLFLAVDRDSSGPPTFVTAKELFDRYWELKATAVTQRPGVRSDNWLQVIEILCDEMAGTQQLTVAREKLDGIPQTYREGLASEGVITFDGHRYGFGHESFFDYCFARLFMTRSESLVSFLTQSEQHLFRRAQVRQVLSYLRDADFQRYVRELRALLSDDRMRPHIKDVVFAVLADVSEPTEDEWRIWEDWIAPALKADEQGAALTNKLSRLAWRRFLASPTWLVEADRRGLVESWLASGSDQLVNEVVAHIGSEHLHFGDRLPSLLEPYMDSPHLGGALLSVCHVRG